ncbi:MAG: hypothetical protein GX628_05395 [Clostridiales bacterium]|nr:hypothetical protein [Clostridiales bacterium]
MVNNKYFHIKLTVSAIMVSAALTLCIACIILLPEKITLTTNINQIEADRPSAVFVPAAVTIIFSALFFVNRKSTYRFFHWFDVFIAMIGIAALITLLVLYA